MGIWGKGGGRTRLLMLGHPQRKDSRDQSERQNVWPKNLNKVPARAARFSRVLFFAVILMTPQAQAHKQKTQVIRNDAGGNVNSYLMAVGSAAAFGQTVRIDGWCASACTLYLGSPYTCVTRRATLAFHSPRGGSSAQNRNAARVIATKLPAPVGRWYLQNAATLTGKSYLTLSAQQLVSMGGARYC